MFQVLTTPVSTSTDSNDALVILFNTSTNPESEKTKIYLGLLGHLLEVNSTCLIPGIISEVGTSQTQ